MARIGGPTPRAGTEAAALLAILAAALLWRILFSAAPATPRWFFPETTALYVTEALGRGDLGAQWRALWPKTQVVWVHESPVMMPVATAFQAVLGPSLHLPTLVGAFWGLVTVIAAWLLGRAMRGPVFGLLFAALVAASPLQIAWARLGGLQIGAGAHVLLVAWLAWVAGARASALLTLVAAGAAAASVYHYYAARVAIPLAAVAWVAGLLAARPPARRVLRVLAVMGALVSGAALVAHQRGLTQTLWPRYMGYVGNQGERTAADLAGTVLASVRREIPLVARAYFATGRARHVWGQPTVGLDDSPFNPAMAAGGLALVPLALVGLVGLALALRHPRRDVLWLALVALGLLLPLLSRTSARRLLVFDLGWCALGANALAALVAARGRMLVPTLALAIAVGTWSFATVHHLGDAMSRSHPATIPFGESGFNDGLGCPECVRRARAWQEEVARGAAIVLVDADLNRENRTAPGGLALYGKVAALAAGRPGAFIPYYALVANFDLEPPRIGPVRDGRTDFAVALRQALALARPTEIVWHFAQPTQWERWLAGRLVDAGGERRAVEGPPARQWRTPELDAAFEVVTPWDRREGALRLIDELARLAGAEPRCVDVARVAEQRTPRPVLTLAARDGAPGWAVAGFHEIRAGDREMAVAAVVGMAADGDSRWRLLVRQGQSLVVEPDTGVRRTTSEVLPAPVGRDCALWHAERWWGVDPLAGTAMASPPPAWALPAGRWIGVGRAGDALVLASADQFLLLLDPATGREITRFPAVVPPSLRFDTGECTPVVAGDGWLATLDPLSAALLVYDARGRSRGAVPLGRLLGLPPRGVAAVAVRGAELGVGTGFDQRVLTLTVQVAAECP